MDMLAFSLLSGPNDIPASEGSIQQARLLLIIGLAVVSLFETFLSALRAYVLAQRRPRWM